VAGEQSTVAATFRGSDREGLLVADGGNALPFDRLTGGVAYRMVVYDKLGEDSRSHLGFHRAGTGVTFRRFRAVVGG